MLGVRGQLWVYEATDPNADGQPLAALLAALPHQTAWGRKRKHRTSPITYLAQVYLGQEQRSGPVNIIGWWERDDDGKVLLHAVMSNLPPTAWTKAYGKRRMWIEIVFSQVTKTDVGTRFCGWDDIANFDLFVLYDHTIDQQFDQLTTLGKGGLRQSCLEAFTQRLDRGDGCARLVKLFTHMRQLPRLDLQVVTLLHQLALTSLEFRQFNRFGQIRCQQAVPLAVETAERLLDAGVVRQLDLPAHVLTGNGLFRKDRASLRVEVS
jgi:hypothetical protein